MAAKKAKAPTASEKLDAIGIEAICEKVADCEFYADIAKSAGVSRHALMNWLATHEDMYARAREARADKMAEDMLAISDDGTNDTYIDENGNRRTDHDVIARSRLRVDTRKWLASKMFPKKYGEKVTQEVTGKDGGPQEHVVSVRPQISREEWLKEHGLNK